MQERSFTIVVCSIVKRSPLLRGRKSRTRCRASWSCQFASQDLYQGVHFRTLATQHSGVHIILVRVDRCVEPMCRSHRFAGSGERQERKRLHIRISNSKGQKESDVTKSDRQLESDRTEKSIKTPCTKIQQMVEMNTKAPRDVRCGASSPPHRRASTAVHSIFTSILPQSCFHHASVPKSEHRPCLRAC